VVYPRDAQRKRMNNCTVLFLPQAQLLNGDRGRAQPCYSCSISLLYHISLWIVTIINQLLNCYLVIP
jgi:hypothetical protein